MRRQQPSNDDRTVVPASHFVSTFPRATCRMLDNSHTWGAATGQWALFDGQWTADGFGHGRWLLSLPGHPRAQLSCYLDSPYRRRQRQSAVLLGHWGGPQFACALLLSFIVCSACASAVGAHYQLTLVAATLSIDVTGAEARMLPRARDRLSALCPGATLAL